MEFLDGTTGRRQSADSSFKWYFRKSFLILAIFTIGPLALPFIWFRPKTSLHWKIAISVATLILTWFLVQATLKSFEAIKALYQMMDDFKI
jgi:hypothetical protein